MKISVITVCFNSEKTIERSIKSVAAQTGAQIEHIVIDGGSTDRTREILSHNSCHISRMISEPDHGIYDAMNKGISLSSGDIICFLNADDVYANSQALSYAVRRMASEHMDVAYGDVAFFRPENPEKPIRRYRSSRFKPSRIAWGWMPAHPALFVRRSILEKIGSFKTSYRIAGDFELIARLFNIPDLRYHHIPEVIVHMSTGGISTGGWRNTMLLNREVIRACRENGIYTNSLMILSKYPYKLLEYVLP